MKFEVGDRVKDKTFGEGKVIEKEKDTILVQFFKKNYRLHSGSTGKNGPYEDNTCLWYDQPTQRLEKLEYTYEDLKKSPIGTKITFENGRVFVRVEERCTGQEFTDINGYRGINNLQGLKDNWLKGYYGKIIKIEEPTYKTVYETQKEILDEVEKKYLSTVIRPFKNKIKTITKVSKLIDNKAYIEIFLKSYDTCCLPDFSTNTIYRGMEVNKEYTLKELGL